MAGIFRRRQQDGEQHEPVETVPGDGAPEPENREGAHLERLYSRWVPASVRTPDAMRIGVPAADDADGPDDDVQFIASLLDEVERSPQQAQRVTPAPQPRIERRIERVRMPDEPAPQRITESLPAPAQDDMRYFREMKADRDHPPLSQALRVSHVEMADLLETLETTAAALRRRRAA